MENRLLRAGPLSAEFIDGNLRDIRWYGMEAIRAITYLVRDENWGNYPLEFSGLAVEEKVDHFRVSYRTLTRSRTGASLAVDIVIDGFADGRLCFDAKAIPDKDFVTNRCGFNILHPINGVSGNRAAVEHVDGSIEHSQFPDVIDPAQPFLSMRAITHEIVPGVSVECRMEGGTFEMEDQRNWTDASYKTYVRPLALPWPYTLPAGEPDHQRIVLSFEGKPEKDSAPSNGVVKVAIGNVIGKVPRFGLGIRPSDLSETLKQIEALSEIGPSDLILYFSPLEGHGITELRNYAELLSLYPAQATLEFVFACRSTPDEELHDLSFMMAKSGLKVSALAVSPAPDLKSTPPGSRWPECPSLAEIYLAARATFPDLRIGGGMFSYFTQLNRKRPPVELIDFIKHTTAPLVHAADDRSVMETLEALPHVTRSVRAFTGNMPYRIGPSAIGMRHNPYGASLNDNPDGLKMTMVENDPRQKEQFAAAWLVGYAAATLDAGLETLSLGSLTGSFGLLDDQGRYPSFGAIKAISGLAGSEARKVTSSDPAKILALAGGDTLLVTNLTPEKQRVEVEDLTLELAPYAIAAHSLKAPI